MELDGLFTGLGNPGPEYAHTRHNLGFMLADLLLAACAAEGACAALSGGKGRYEAWKCRLPGKSGPQWLVVKPMTFMNRSGEAVLPLMRYYRIPLDKLFAAHDELDLPFGKLRLKFGGGSAGHKGVDSLVECAGSQDFHRLRLGIGKPLLSDTLSFVLGRFGPEEKQALPAVLAAALDGFFTFAREGPAPAQRRINPFSPPPRAADVPDTGM
jgi:PTH1 family peptidyl-tRNA hydrolase